VIHILDKIDPEWIDTNAFRQRWPDIVAGTKDDQAARRMAALQLLDQMNVVRAETIPILIDRLADESFPVCDIAIRLLGKAAVEKPRLIDTLIPWLFRFNDERGGQTTRELATALRRIDPDWQNREIAREALQRAGEMLESADVPTRRAAAFGVLHYRRQARFLLPRLLPLLVAEDDTTRTAARDALRDVAPDWRTCSALSAMIPDLTSQLATGDIERRVAVIDLLATAEISRKDPPLIGVQLLRWLDLTPPYTQATVSALVNQFRDTDSEIRLAGVSALGRIGAPAAPAKLPLARLLLDSDTRVRSAVANSLQQIDRNWQADPRLRIVISEIADHCHNGAVEERRLAIRTLALFGGSAAPAVPTLIEALSDSDVTIQAEAIRALEAIGPQAVSAIPALVKLQDDRSLRFAVERALQKIRTAVPAEGAKSER
jgi:HEAT repeat protein